MEVPNTPTALKAPGTARSQPIDPVYYGMALAQMHAEGKIQPEKFPDIDHEEAARPEQGQNFQTLYQQLRDNKDKVKPGNLLRLFDKKGNDFYYKRDDDYEHGFRWHPKPPEHVS